LESTTEAGWNEVAPPPIRDLIVERTQAGLTRAKAGGKTLGRPPKTTPEQRKAIIDGYAIEQSVSALATRYDISRTTVLSIVKRPIKRNSC
jgi:putative DNA-invertase from lambdoid prophage Rac